MSNVNICDIQRENLTFLIDHIYGNQTILAARLDNVITQPTLSDILRKKRSFHELEVRAIEKKLDIPHNWMDKKGWICDGWELIVKYKKMNVEDKVFFHKTIKFIEFQCEKA